MPNNPPAEAGKFPNTLIQWDDGSNFSGFIIATLHSPLYNSVPASATDFTLVYPAENIPTVAQIPINNGLIDQSLGLLYNADIAPPNSRYSVCYYDSNKNLIACDEENFFIVSTNPINNLPIPTLFAPSAPGPE